MDVISLHNSSDYNGSAISYALVTSTAAATGGPGDQAGENCLGETFAEVLLKYAVGSLLIFIIFMSISGNLLVCIAIYTDRRLRKLQNIFLASLALSDLLLALSVMTFAVANDLMGYWAFGDQFCETWIAFDVMCCTASIVNLCAISLDRFMHIKDPFGYEQWMTKRVVLASVTGVWLLAALVSFVPIGFGWHRPADSGPPISPSLAPFTTVSVGDSTWSSMTSRSDWPTTVAASAASTTEPPELPQCALDLTPTYAVVSSSISFYVPCLIMVALYTRLYLYARKHVRDIKSVTRPLHVGSLPGGDPQSATGSDHNSQSHQRQHLKDHKAAITLGIIMGVFLFCWVPFFCINIIASFCKTCIPLSVFKILTWLGYFNSAMNPVIYSIFNSEFRDAFRRILVGYVRTDCCGRDERRASRNTTDGGGGGGGGAGQQGSTGPVPSTPRTPKPRSSSMDLFPIKSKINYNSSEGKISAI